MIWVSIRPAAPTMMPPMMSIVFPIANPLAATARPDTEFSNEIITGMSAPPTGATAKKPTARLNRSRNRIARAAYRTSTRDSDSAMATTVRIDAPTTSGPRPGTRVSRLSLPHSLASARIDPDRVAAPITTETARASPAMAPMRPMAPSPASGETTSSQNSASPTRAAAAPLNPLNLATTCGMEVAEARRTVMTPTVPPAARPRTIQV